MLTARQLATLRRSRCNGRNKLKLAIALAKTTQVEVAAAVEVTQPHVSAIAGGRYGDDGLPLETARKLAAHFGCAIEDLFPAAAAQVA